ncbi:MAG: hypothetical protein GKS07_00870 [Nitrosopumilus sp.]|nr:MAG: hypothetical protein GKS07_00870 [Nitrosopumilus sp.]
MKNNKTKKYLSLFAVMAVVISGGMYVTSFENADADDINKGIGKTEIWEPGPTDGFTPTEMPYFENQNANELKSYVEKKSTIAIPENALILSSKELDRTLDELRQSDLPIVMSAIDYDTGVIAIWTPDTTIGEKFKAELGDVPFVLLYEEAPARWQHGDPGENGAQLEPKLDLQSWIPSVYAAGVSGDNTHYGTKVTDNNNADGIYSRMEVHTDENDVTIVSGNTLYAPAMSVADQGRLEIVVHYSSYDEPRLRVWDHNGDNEGFIESVDMDNNNFNNRYVNTVSGSDYIYTKVELNSGTWYAYYYDLIDTEWDILIAKGGGIGDQDYGWNVYEVIDTADPGDCSGTTVPEIISTDGQVRNSGSWSYATSSHASAFNSTPLDCASGSWNNNYYNWDVS